MQTLAEQLVLMVQEDYPEGGDTEAMHHATENYTADAIYELQTKVKEMI